MKDLSRKFLKKYNFDTNFSVEVLTENLLKDMNQGLKGEKAFQDMIKTWFDPSTIRMQDKSVIVIDAGGTNFRSCMVNFSNNGDTKISSFQKTFMPGTTGLLSKSQFFDQIAENISRFKDKCSEICFCFSYPMTITDDQDGILIAFSKEIKAPEVEGCKIGEELSKTLAEKGWKIVPRVFLLNDTASALLAGTGDQHSSSNVGFILGTGMNAAYIQKENMSYPGLKKQIIVCETAKFGDVSRSYFDIQLDMHSAKPGCAPLEKMCSGAYLGPLALEMLKIAAEDGLFSDDTTQLIRRTTRLSLVDVCCYLKNEVSDSSPLSYVKKIDHVNDYQIIIDLFDVLLDRAARISASVIAACLVKTEDGKEKEKPINVICNGSTFLKGWKIYERTQTYLKQFAESRSLHYKLLSTEDDITVGTAMAALAV